MLLFSKSIHKAAPNLQVVTIDFIPDNKQQVGFENLVRHFLRSCFINQISVTIFIDIYNAATILFYHK